MAQNDLYEIADHYTHLGQDCVNVFHVVQSLNVVATTTNMAERVAAGFAGVIQPAILAIQNTGVNHNRISVRNLFNANESYDWLQSQNGGLSLASTDTLPKHDTVVMTFDGERASIRKARKSWSGMIESYTANGLINTGVFVTAAANLGNLLVTGFNVDGTASPRQFRFCTVKRIKVTTPKGVAYRLPENVGEADYSRWTSFFLNLEISTQNSRKD